MDRERSEDEKNEGLNAVGAAGQSTDPNVAEPVSGMPAGGPHDLGEKAARKQDATGQA
jgi:hypothetical protein